MATHRLVGLPRGTAMKSWGMGSRPRLFPWPRTRTLRQGKGHFPFQGCPGASQCSDQSTCSENCGDDCAGPQTQLNKLGPSVPIPSPRFDEGLQSRVGGGITPVRGKECLWWVEATMTQKMMCERQGQNISKRNGGKILDQFT